MLERGSYILLDYTVIVKDENRVVETTIEEKAKENNIYDPERVYEPKLIILGETKIFQPLEEELYKADEGSEIVVEIPPEQAYGQRDPNKVKIVSIKEFYRQGRIPKVGDVIEVEGKGVAKVISISSGRVVLDLNHPLAGKTLIVHAKVVKKLTSDEEKIKYLIKNYIPRVDASKIRVELSDGGSVVRVELPRETIVIDKIGIIKASIADEIGRRFSQVKRVIFIDQFEIERGK